MKIQIKQQPLYLLLLIFTITAFLWNQLFETSSKETQGKCGDGLKGPDEECDSGIFNSGNNEEYGCSNQCTKNFGWDCSEDDDTLSTCTPWVLGKRILYCGDGYYDAGEDCDFTTSYNTDTYGCSSTCTTTNGYSCSWTSNDYNGYTICTSTCGNAAIDNAQETCDLGSSYNGMGYGCSSTCTVSPGYGCSQAYGTSYLSGTSSSCTTGCGDGYYDSGESCDLGWVPNRQSLGCSLSCTVETGYQCTWSGSTTTSTSTCTATTSVCGDSAVDSGEACDDGNTASGDGCSSTCTLETGYTCTGGSSSSADTCNTVCGDGKRVGSEACDDGDTSSGDGCSSTCTVETGYACTGGSSSSADTCTLASWSGASLTECQTIAGYFNNTCSSSTAVSISSVPTTSFTCTSNGLACASTSTCTFSRQLCATCTTSSDGIVYLRVQTNSIPDHCVYTTTNALASSQIDFSVALQTDLSLTTTLSVTTQANVDYYECSDVSTWVASVPSRVYYTNTAGSAYADKIVGVAFNGVPIMHGGQEYPYDPYFPKLSSGSAVAYESDTCLGNNDHTTFYHYYTYSPCITETAMKYNLNVIECSDNTICNLNPMSYASAMVSSANRTLQEIGIAKDGYLIYGPYKNDGSLWQPCDVDACNGKSIDGSYAYVSTLFYPYTVGCWGPSSTAYYSPTCSSNPKTCSFGSYLANSVSAFLLVIAAIFLTY